MRARIAKPASLVDGAGEALTALDKALEQSHLPPITRYLVFLRASQINGCSFCVDLHSRELRRAEVSDERISAVSAWRETPYFSEAERAALGLTEAMTRLSDRSDPVPLGVWGEVSKQYDQPDLAALVLSIATINLWNRLNAATAQVAGT